MGSRERSARAMSLARLADCGISELCRLHSETSPLPLEEVAILYFVDSTNGASKEIPCSLYMRPSMQGAGAGAGAGQQYVDGYPVDVIRAAVAENVCNAWRDNLPWTCILNVPDLSQVSVSMWRRPFVDLFMPAENVPRTVFGLLRGHFRRSLMLQQDNSIRYDYTITMNGFSIASALYPTCHRCAASGEGMLWCAGCKGVQYCGISCQRADWATHKSQCTRGNLQRLSSVCNPQALVLMEACTWPNRPSC
jgi:hypothetical protein